MRMIRLPMRDIGTLVDLRIGLTPAEVRNVRRAGRRAPSPVRVRALIDLNAERSSIDQSVLGRLKAAGLEIAEHASVREPLPVVSRRVELYWLRLTLLHPSGRPQDHLVLPQQLLAEARIDWTEY